VSRGQCALAYPVLLLLLHRARQAFKLGTLLHRRGNRGRFNGCTSCILESRLNFREWWGSAATAPAAAIPWRPGDLAVLVWVHPPRQHEAGDVIINRLVAVLKGIPDGLCEVTIFPIGKAVRSRHWISKQFVGPFMRIKVWMTWVMRGSLPALSRVEALR